MIAHKPVMIDEMIAYLKPQDGETYVDCTFGAGGYSRKILESAKCKLYSIDQDQNILAFAEQLREDFSEDHFIFINDNFINLAEYISTDSINGIVFDLGVSSMQLDQASRGFSFGKQAKLDMRMGKQEIDAWYIVNKYSEQDLADIIYFYGEEHFARRIAKQIVTIRQNTPINTTTELADIVRKVVKKSGKIDPATKTFQAIRIYVNDELRLLRKTLVIAYNLLRLNGRMVIVSFQGLENKIIKDFLQRLPNAITSSAKPSNDEIKTNPRARSAKLWSITKTNIDPILQQEGVI